MTARQSAVPHRSTGSPLELVFPILWVPAHLFHIAIQPSLNRFDFTEFAVTCAGVVLLARPRSTAALLALAAAQLVDWLSQAPYAPDHWNLVAIGNLILIGTWLVRSRTGRSPVLAAAPSLRLALLIAYGAAALSKWNEHFWDPAVSCAVEIGSRATFGLIEIVPGHGPALIALAVTAETLIFTLLVIPRTRSYGVRAGVLFHGLFSFGPVIGVWDFTAALFALLVLFLPDDELRRVLDRLRGSFDGSPVVAGLQRFRWPLLAGLVVLITAIDSDPLPNTHALVWMFFPPYFLLTVQSLLPTTVSTDRVRWSRPSVVALLPLAALAFTAINPYIGLRTTGSFTMFSNLQTEGPGSNHFLIDGWHLTNHQTDLIRLESSTINGIQESADDNQALVLSTLRVQYLVEPDTAIVGQTNDGQTLRWSVEESDDLIGPPSVMERWLLSFRSVALDGQAICQN